MSARSPRVCVYVICNVLYIYIYIYTQTYIYLYMYTHIHTYTCVHTYVHKCVASLSLQSLSAPRSRHLSARTHEAARWRAQASAWLRPKLSYNVSGRMLHVSCLLICKLSLRYYFMWLHSVSKYGLWCHSIWHTHAHMRVCEVGSRHWLSTSGLAYCSWIPVTCERKGWERGREGEREGEMGRERWPTALSRDSTSPSDWRHEPCLFWWALGIGMID